MNQLVVKVLLCCFRMTIWGRARAWRQSNIRVDWGNTSGSIGAIHQGRLGQYQGRFAASESNVDTHVDGLVCRMRDKFG